MECSPYTNLMPFSTTAARGSWWAGTLFVGSLMSWLQQGESSNLVTSKRR